MRPERLRDFFALIVLQPLIGAATVRVPQTPAAYGRHDALLAFELAAALEDALHGLLDMLAGVIDHDPIAPEQLEVPPRRVVLEELIVVQVLVRQPREQLAPSVVGKELLPDVLPSCMRKGDIINITFILVHACWVLLVLFLRWRLEASAPRQRHLWAANT